MLHRSRRTLSSLCVLTIATASVAAHATGHTHQGDHWAFVTPLDWVDMPGGSAALVSVVAPTPTAGFSFNVNLVREPFAGNTQAYVAANLVTLNRIGHVVAQRSSMAGPFVAIDVDTQWGGAQPHLTVQRMVAAGGFGYVLTCTVIDVTAGRAVCDPILRTLQITP